MTAEIATAPGVLVPVVVDTGHQADAEWLAVHVPQAIGHVRRAMTDWLEVGERLARVRQDMPADREFGAWCAAHDYFGSAERPANLSDAIAAHRWVRFTNSKPDDLDTGSVQELAARWRQHERGETPEQKNEWYTPPWVFDLLGVTFDIDVAAPLDPDSRRVPARRHYTIDDDGLAQPWHGLIWCNPPYQTPSPWIDRWADHDNGLILTHASVRAKRTLKLWHAADAIVMFSKMYFARPNGADEDINLLLQIAARGDEAVAALRHIAGNGPYAGPLWRPS